MLRYHTAGESHGKALVALIDGFPAGVEIRREPIDAELHRRQGGYGRGGRQRIEADRVEILSGLRQGKTIGSPIALMVANRDHRIDRTEDITSPRPGHGDLSGSIKYLDSICGVLERASARETAARVAAGALVRQLLTPLGIDVFGYVVQVGPIVVSPLSDALDQRRAARDRSELYTLNPEQDAEIKTSIDRIEKRGDTLGGLLEVRVEGVPFGLGSHTQWDGRLDGRLAQAVMSVQAIKGIDIGLGFEAACRTGSEVHDPIHYDPALADTPSLGFTRPTNNAGGLEAGISNSQPIVLRAAMKPICTLTNPMDSVDLETLRSAPASHQRSDVCAIAAASCIVENVVAFEIARAMVDKFGGDSLAEIRARWTLFHDMAREKLGSRVGTA
ncbi:MAG: chorismate synthase [Pirellulales bacterium]|nr:chorismate synthase [Pirellulales bacterium]